MSAIEDRTGPYRRKIPLIKHVRDASVANVGERKDALNQGIDPPEVIPQAIGLRQAKALVEACFNEADRVPAEPPTAEAAVEDVLKVILNREDGTTLIVPFTPGEEACDNRSLQRDNDLKDDIEALGTQFEEALVRVSDTLGEHEDKLRDIYHGGGESIPSWAHELITDQGREIDMLKAGLERTAALVEALSGVVKFNSEAIQDYVGAPPARRLEELKAQVEELEGQMEEVDSKTGELEYRIDNLEEFKSDVNNAG